MLVAKMHNQNMNYIVFKNTKDNCIYLKVNGGNPAKLKSIRNVILAAKSLEVDFISDSFKKEMDDYISSLHYYAKVYLGV